MKYYAKKSSNGTYYPSRTIAVDGGFNWWALLFGSWVWVFNEMFLIGIPLLLIQVGLRLFIGELGGIGVLLVNVFLGFKANKLREKYLLLRGYSVVKKPQSNMIAQEAFPIKRWWHWFFYIIGWVPPVISICLLVLVQVIDGIPLAEAFADTVLLAAFVWLIGIPAAFGLIFWIAKYLDYVSQEGERGNFFNATLHWRVYQWGIKVFIVYSIFLAVPLVRTYSLIFG